jgi:energy-coupling factor transport system permease protein
MLKNITIGQYYPGNSVVHRVDPRVKLVLTTAYIVLLFLAGNALALLTGLLVLLIVYPVAGIPLKVIWRSIKPILPIILFTAVLNMFFVQGDIVLWEWWILRISDQGVVMAFTMCTRIILLIAGSTLLTYTTTPITLTDAIERLFSPLKKIRVPVHEIAMMMTIALRMIPTLIEETDKIISAQKARGADMESGSIFQRIRALIPILIPLFVSAFRRADELALAMESRCYHGGEGRTRMRQMHMSSLDLIASLFMAAFLALTVLANQFAWMLGVVY